jgi:hypothetical protein
MHTTHPPRARYAPHVRCPCRLIALLLAAHTTLEDGCDGEGSSSVARGNRFGRRPKQKAAAQLLHVVLLQFGDHVSSMHRMVGTVQHRTSNAIHGHLSARVIGQLGETVNHTLKDRQLKKERGRRDTTTTARKERYRRNAGETVRGEENTASDRVSTRNFRSHPPHTNAHHSTRLHEHTTHLPQVGEVLGLQCRSKVTNQPKG